MLQMAQGWVWILAAILFGLAAGVGVGWLLATLRAQRERLALSNQIAALTAERQEQEEDLAAASEQIAFLQSAREALAGEVNAQKIIVARLEAERAAQEEKLQWTAKEEEHMSNAFQALASQVMRQNTDSFLKYAEEVVKPLDEALEKVEERAREIEQKREGAYGELKEQLRALADAHGSLLKTTTTLSQALRSPTVRGRWGEIELRRVVELAGMVNHVDFDEQTTMEAGRPDMVIRLPERGVIYVDAKVTLDAYLEAAGAQTEEERASRLTKHAQDVLARARQLGSRNYWKGETTPDLVVMFVPNEACLSAAFDRDATILDKAIESRVLITSPVTLLALLKAVAYGWQQVQIAENAREMYDQAKELYDRISTFVGHVNALGRSIQSAAESYNRAVGSLEGRILPFARHFEELGAGATPMTTPPRVETATRHIAGAAEE